MLLVKLPTSELHSAGIDTHFPLLVVLIASPHVATQRHSTTQPPYFHFNTFNFLLVFPQPIPLQLETLLSAKGSFFVPERSGHLKCFINLPLKANPKTTFLALLGCFHK